MKLPIQTSSWIARMAFAGWITAGFGAGGDLLAQAPAEGPGETPAEARAPDPAADPAASPAIDPAAAPEEVAEDESGRVPVAGARASGTRSRTQSDDLKLPSYGDKFLRMLYTLGAMLLALFLVAKFLPRLLKSKSGGFEGGLFKGLAGGSGKRMQVVERLRLDARKSLCLVRVGGRYMLLGVSEQRVELVSGEDLDPEALRALDDAGVESAEPRARDNDVVEDGVSGFGDRLLRRARERSREDIGENSGGAR